MLSLRPYSRRQPIKEHLIEERVLSSFHMCCVFCSIYVGFWIQLKVEHKHRNLWLAVSVKWHQLQWSFNHDVENVVSSTVVLLPADLHDIIDTNTFKSGLKQFCLIVHTDLFYCCMALLDGAYSGALQIAHCIALYCIMTFWYLFRMMSRVVYVIQMKHSLKSRLKLIVMISLSIHMMTSQGRMCVQCVTNGLQRKEVWMITA